MVELPPQVVKALLDVGVSRAEVEAAWASLSPGSRHGLGLARRLLEREAAQPAQLERALGGSRPAAPPQPQLAGYTLVRPLGRGGMGEVFLARDAQGREFALKRVSEVQDTVLVARFMREIRALCALEHPHLARIHDAGVVGQTPYYVLDLYPGGSLAERIAGGPLDPEEARGVALKLAAALDVVHAQGLVHRDVKPENVLFDAEGEPRLADFGLATAGERSLAGGRLTLTAEVLGTPAYMAPEQALDASQVGPAADVYALGAVLYAMLCGRPPFTGDSLLEVLSALLDRAPTPPHKLAPRVPLALSEVCLRALAKEPEGRYPDVRAFAQALGGARARTGAPRRALALLGLSAIAAAVAGVAAWQAWRADLAPAPSAPASAPWPDVEGLARAGLPEAAWARWCLEPPGAEWVRRGEALLVRGLEPSPEALLALDLPRERREHWEAWLTARGMLSRRRVGSREGASGERLRAAVIAGQRLRLASSALRDSFATPGGDPRVIAERIQADAAEVYTYVARWSGELDPESPVDAALLGYLAERLAEYAIYGERRLFDGEARVPFEEHLPVDSILALGEALPSGHGRRALEFARAVVTLDRDWTREHDVRGRTDACAAFASAVTPESLAPFAVQLRVWGVWWLLECEFYRAPVDGPALVAELERVLADMEATAWALTSFDGRRFLDEDELYRLGAKRLAEARYPREPPPPGEWPDVEDLAQLVTRAMGSKRGVIDVCNLANVLLAGGRGEEASVQVERLKREKEVYLTLAALDLARARRADSEIERAAHLQRAADHLAGRQREDWPRPFWAAWIHLLALRGDVPAEELAAAEEAWADAEPMQFAPAPYRLFDPARLHVLPRPGARVLPFPP